MRASISTKFFAGSYWCPKMSNQTPRVVCLKKHFFWGNFFLCSFKLGWRVVLVGAVQCAFLQTKYLYNSWQDCVGGVVCLHPKLVGHIFYVCRSGVHVSLRRHDSSTGVSTGSYWWDSLLVSQETSGKIIEALSPKRSMLLAISLCKH